MVAITGFLLASYTTKEYALALAEGGQVQAVDAFDVG